MIERPGSLDTPAWKFWKNKVIVEKYLKSEKESVQLREEDRDPTET